MALTEAEELEMLELEEQEAMGAQPMASVAQEPQSEGLGKQLLRSSIDALPAIGGAVGGIVGGGAGLFGGPAAPLTVPAGGLAGGTLGYGMGSELKDLGNQYLLGEKPKANAWDQPAETAKRVAGNLKDGAMFEMGGQAIGKGIGLGVGAAAPYAKAAYDKASAIGNKALPKVGNILADIPEQFSKKYLSKSGDITARTETEILDDLTNRWHEADRAVQTAKDAVGTSKESLRAARDTAANELRDFKFMLSQQRAAAKEGADQAFTATKESLKNNDITSYSGTVLDDIQKLKAEVTRGSKESYDILDNDPNAYGVRRGGQVLRVLADELNIKPFESGKGMTVYNSTAQAGGAPVTAQSAGVQAQMRDFAKRLEATPEKIPARELKKILQQIDESEKALYGQPGFDGRVSRAYKLVRKTIDDAVKAANPEYALKMEEVAENSRILNKALESFGDETAAISRLKGIGTEKGQQVDLPILRDLGRKTGTDYDAPISSYVQNQRTLGTPSEMNALRESLPEYQNLRAIDDEYTKMLDPSLARGIDDLPPVREAADALSVTERSLEQAKANFDVMAPVSPGAAQSKLRSFTGARDYNPKKIFSKIDEATGHNFSDEIENRAILNSFDKSSTNGSRKTVMGSVIGTAVGAIAGPVGAGIGGGVGGMAGFAADKYAGKMFKAMLDGKISADVAMKALGPQLGAYGPILQSAAQRGSQGLASTHFILESTDPQYREIIRSVADRDQQGE